MSDPPNEDTTRALGIDFGALAQQLERHEYPATTDELVALYGDTVLTLENGEQTLRDVFEAADTESFTSAEDVRQAIFNRVDEQAIGRKSYSDRNPPTQKEQVDSPDESF